MGTLSSEPDPELRTDITFDCYSCARESERDALPDRELIAVDEHWRVAHATGSALAGWLVLMPRRHVLEVAELTDTESALLGGWQVRLARALRRVVGADKIYVTKFGEMPGFHLHFHIVPRPPDLAEQVRGPKVFGLLGRTGDTGEISEAERDDLARRIRAQL